MSPCRRLLLAGCLAALLAAYDEGRAERALVIAASPSLAEALKALGKAYEATHPDVRVQLYFDAGLDLRRTIAAMENNPRGEYFIGKGPIHLIAPGGDELIDRLEQKYYVLPGTRRAYLEERLVLIVPESLVEAPTSFDALREGRLRVAVSDPERTQTGRMTAGLLKALGLSEVLKGRLDVASDGRGVLDHLLSGQADVGVALVREAVQDRQRVRIVAVAEPRGYQPVLHSMAMERYCPDRALCADFLNFLQSPDARSALKELGYGSVVPPPILR